MGLIMIRNSYSEINAFALTGRVDNSPTKPQGVALGYVLLPLWGVPTASICKKKVCQK